MNCKCNEAKSLTILIDKIDPKLHKHVGVYCRRCESILVKNKGDEK